MKYYAYDEFKKDTVALLKKIEPQNYDAIVGIARGGLMLSHAISEALCIRNVQTLRTELYDANVKRKEFLLHDNTTFKSEKRVLVVDDIADSGETFLKVMQHLREKYPEIEFVSVALFYKESSVYEPVFWVNEATEWIEFFWESDFNA